MCIDYMHTMPFCIRDLSTCEFLYLWGILEPFPHGYWRITLFTFLTEFYPLSPESSYFHSLKSSLRAYLQAGSRTCRGVFLSTGPHCLCLGFAVRQRTLLSQGASWGHRPVTTKPHLLNSPSPNWKWLHYGGKRNTPLFGEFKDFPEDSIANPETETMGLVPSQAGAGVLAAFNIWEDS